MTRNILSTTFLAVLVLSSIFLGSILFTDTAHAQEQTLNINADGLLSNIDAEMVGIGFWILVFIIIVLKILGLIWAIFTGFIPFI
ncbi:hypothetical protein [Halolamina salifodinae]|uniref:Uncharacterized protein n=1 Tax=Halolamina salifodinae TaxID=1202767 RepID=A0A8T4GXT6_9EURY|nr:hypothetical protein [Halolamina salifodinae]MBP1987002.1 hypothetical protein [Halolamina salifodinae]